MVAFCASVVGGIMTLFIFILYIIKANGYIVPDWIITASWILFAWSILSGILKAVDNHGTCNNRG